jgi:hypothetical protein
MTKLSLQYRGGKHHEPPCHANIALAAACQPVEASTVPDGNWHTRACHPVQHFASNLCFGVLAGQCPGEESPSNNGFVPIHYSFKASSVVARTTLLVLRTAVAAGVRWSGLPTTRRADQMIPAKWNWSRRGRTIATATSPRFSSQSCLMTRRLAKRTRVRPPKSWRGSFIALRSANPPCRSQRTKNRSPVSVRRTSHAASSGPHRQPAMVPPKRRPNTPAAPFNMRLPRRDLCRMHIMQLRQLRQLLLTLDRSQSHHLRFECWAVAAP